MIPRESVRDGLRRRALACGLLLSATLLPATPALGQPMPERAQEIAILRQLIADVESQREVVLAPLGTSAYGTFVMVPRDRVGEVAGMLVFAGRLHPDSLEAWTREQLNLSRGALSVMKEQLARLEAGEEWSTPPPSGPTERSVPAARVDPSAPYWPVPMTWTEVRGQVRGDYRVQCYYDDRRLPELRGRFLFDLRGGGVVLASYTDEQYTREANGSVDSEGRAAGSGQATDSGVAWMATFAREGGRLVIWNTALTLTPRASGARCDPGVLDPD